MAPQWQIVDLKTPRNFATGHPGFIGDDDVGDNDDDDALCT